MQLDIRHVDLQVSDVLCASVRRRVEGALRTFQENAERVDVLILDAPGHRGGAADPPRRNAPASVRFAWKISNGASVRGARRIGGPRGSLARDAKVM